MATPSFYKKGLSYFAAILIGGLATFAGQSVYTAINPGVVQSLSAEFTSVAGTQVLCSFQNTSGFTRTLDSVEITYATDTATGGNVNFQISVSDSATATGTTLLYNNTLAVPNTITITNTSTLFTAKTAVLNGKFINYMIAAPTSTLAGRCQATWHN